MPRDAMGPQQTHAPQNGDRGPFRLLASFS